MVRLNIHCNSISPILSYLVQNKAQKQFPIKWLLKKEKKRKTKENKKQSGCLCKRADADKPRILKTSHKSGTSYTDQKAKFIYLFIVYIQYRKPDFNQGHSWAGHSQQRHHPETRCGGCQERWLSSLWGQSSHVFPVHLQKEMNPGGPRTKEAGGGVFLSWPRHVNQF